MVQTRLQHSKGASPKSPGGGEELKRLNRKRRRTDSTSSSSSSYRDSESSLSKSSSPESPEVKLKMRRSRWKSLETPQRSSPRFMKKSTGKIGGSLRNGEPEKEKIPNVPVQEESRNVTAAEPGPEGLVDETTNDSVLSTSTSECSELELEENNLFEEDSDKERFSDELPGSKPDTPSPPPALSEPPASAGPPDSNSGSTVDLPDSDNRSSVDPPDSDNGSNVDPPGFEPPLVEPPLEDSREGPTTLVKERELYLQSTASAPSTEPASVRSAANEKIVEFSSKQDNESSSLKSEYFPEEIVKDILKELLPAETLESESQAAEKMYEETDAPGNFLNETVQESVISNAPEELQADHLEDKVLEYEKDAKKCFELLTAQSESEAFPNEDVGKNSEDPEPDSVENKKSDSVDGFQSCEEVTTSSKNGTLMDVDNNMDKEVVLPNTMEMDNHIDSRKQSDEAVVPYEVNQDGEDTSSTEDPESDSFKEESLTSEDDLKGCGGVEVQHENVPVAVGENGPEDDAQSDPLMDDIFSYASVPDPMSPIKDQIDDPSRPEPESMLVIAALKSCVESLNNLLQPSNNDSVSASDGVDKQKDLPFRESTPKVIAEIEAPTSSLISVADGSTQETEVVPLEEVMNICSKDTTPELELKVLTVEVEFRSPAAPPISLLTQEADSKAPTAELIYDGIEVEVLDTSTPASSDSSVTELEEQKSSSSPPTLKRQYSPEVVGDALLEPLLNTKRVCSETRTLFNFNEQPVESVCEVTSSSETSTTGTDESMTSASPPSPVIKKKIASKKRKRPDGTTRPLYECPEPKCNKGYQLLWAFKCHMIKCCPLLASSQSHLPVTPTEHRKKVSILSPKYIEMVMSSKDQAAVKRSIQEEMRLKGKEQPSFSVKKASPGDGSRMASCSSCKSVYQRDTYTPNSYGSKVTKIQLCPSCKAKLPSRRVTPIVNSHSVIGKSPTSTLQEPVLQKIKIDSPGPWTNAVKDEDERKKVAIVRPVVQPYKGASASSRSPGSPFALSTPPKIEMIPSKAPKISFQKIERDMEDEILVVTDIPEPSRSPVRELNSSESADEKLRDFDPDRFFADVFDSLPPENFLNGRPQDTPEDNLACVIMKLEVVSAGGWYYHRKGEFLNSRSLARKLNSGGRAASAGKSVSDSVFKTPPVPPSKSYGVISGSSLSSFRGVAYKGRTSKPYQQRSAPFRGGKLFSFPRKASPSSESSLSHHQQPRFYSRRGDKNLKSIEEAHRVQVKGEAKKFGDNKYGVEGPSASSSVSNKSSGATINVLLEPSNGPPSQIFADED